MNGMKILNWEGNCCGMF